MKAQEILHIKECLQDGGIIEMVIWKLPETRDESGHNLKYRLYYGRAGERLVGYLPLCLGAPVGGGFLDRCEGCTR